MTDDDTRKRKLWIETWRPALEGQLVLGELFMKVDRALLSPEERAEVQSIADNAIAQFKALGEVMSGVASEEFYQQALASSELLLEETRRAINLLERLLAKQGK